MKNNTILILLIMLLPGLIYSATITSLTGNKNIKPAQHHRLIVSSDIGGTDPDDFQSMVHLLLYADTLDIEGLISSPFGPGRKEHILQVIACYEKDYPNLKTYSTRYPTPDQLRAITKEGALETPGPIGIGKSTEGSEWIISCARKKDPRPLNILVWGGIEDLTQALHDAPDILPKLHVYFIGGPNKKWSVDAYNYLANNFKKLWIIEANDTYRGWFTGGNQNGEWSNKDFPSRHIAGCGAMADLFMTQLGGTIKMGDTPSVVRLLHGTPDDPSKPGWGGKYVRAWERPHKIYDRLTASADSIEQFGVLELELHVTSKANEKSFAIMKIENQNLNALVKSEGIIEFIFSPKDAKTYNYILQSNIPEIDGKTGSITSYPPPKTNKLHPSHELPNWWTDDPSPEVSEGVFLGTKTISCWREDYLKDFAKRFLRCKSPNNK